MKESLTQLSDEFSNKLKNEKLMKAKHAWNKNTPNHN